MQVPVRQPINETGVGGKLPIEQDQPRLRHRGFELRNVRMACVRGKPKPFQRDAV